MSAITNTDRLHPTSKNPTVKYVDPTLEVGIKHFSNPKYPKEVPSAPRAPNKSFKNLTDLCEWEYKRRGGTETDPVKRQKAVSQIAYSATNRKNLKTRITITDRALRKELNIKKNTELGNTSIFLNNSSVNGSSYKNEAGKLVLITTPVSGSQDRHAPNIGMAGYIKAIDGESICYKGRPDSLLKAQQQAEMIFLKELHSQKKGLDRTGKNSYTLNYTVFSMMTTSPLINFSKGPERTYTQNEQQALQDLQKKTYKIKDPKTGKTYSVRYRPVLISRQFNFMCNLEKVLSPSLSGKSLSQSISQEGYETFEALIAKKIKKASSEKKKQIQSLLAILKNRESLNPEEEILCVDLICKLLKFPLVYHCKSSTDRTGLAVAISCALDHWIRLKKKIPPRATDLLQKESFKELIAANLMACHQVTRISRGGEGTVYGRTLNPNNLGLSLSRGLQQNPIIKRILPERYLKEVSLINQIAYGSLYFIAALFTTMTSLGYVVPSIFFPELRKHIAFDAIVKFHKAIPQKELDESSPLVGARHFLNGSS